MDVSITIDGGEFIASYSNKNYSEHWYKKDTDWKMVANDIIELLHQLTSKGAQQIDKVRNGRVYATTIKIGDIEESEHVLKVSLLPKKEHQKFPTGDIESNDSMQD